MSHANEHDRVIERLSEYLDGALDAGVHSDVESHLAECGQCRLVLEELQEVVSRAGALGEMEPGRDLWAGIAATIQAPAARDDSGKVIALPTAGRAVASVPDRDEGEAPTRVSFSFPQLAAASIALIAVSSMVTWAAGPGLGVTADAGPVATGTGALVMAESMADVPPALAAELAQLEQALASASADLDPNTVRVLERNLSVIERAIEDSRLALAQDPGNEFLTEHLERVYERKLDFLREAAEVVEWAD